MKYFYFTFLLFLLVRCNSKKEQNAPIVRSEVLSVKDTLPTIAKSNDSVFTEGDFELHKVVVSKKSPIFMAGIEIEGHKGGFVIKRRKKNIWQKCLTVDFDRKILEWTIEDWNNDGFKDIVLGSRYQFKIILFNPKKNEFVDFGTIGNYSVSSLEKSNLLYSFSFYKEIMLDNNSNIYYQTWESELFKIGENYKKIEYGYMNFDTHYTLKNNQEKSDTIPFIHVYKFDSKQYSFIKKIDIRNLKPSLNFIKTRRSGQTDEKADYSNEEDFVEDYWLKNWKAMVKKD
jgi:hypothetical protein